MSVLLLMLQPALNHAAKKPTNKHEIKALYIANFAKFTAWPEYPRDDYFRIGYVGKQNDLLHEAMKKMLGGEKIKRRKIRVEHFDDASGISEAGCQVLVFSRTWSGDLKAVLDEVGKQPILTVLEVHPRAFNELSGIVNFSERRRKLRFKINKALGGQVGLRFDTRLLRLAI